MRILSLNPDPIHEWSYMNAASRGGSEVRALPLLSATVDTLPPEVEALIALSDLQGVAPHALRDGAVALLGEVLADELAMMGDLGELPHPSHTGILLAGDLFSEPGADKPRSLRRCSECLEHLLGAVPLGRGSGWQYDTFGTPREHERFLQQPGIHLLDGEVRELDGLLLGGVSGIIGRTDKPGRRKEADQLERIHGVLRQEPSVLVLHEGPDYPAETLRGSTAIRKAVSARTDLLVICGHSHWETPLATLNGSTQVLNVDARAVLFTRAPA